MRARPTIVVLAAGLGSRFRGSGHKLAQPLGGATVLTCTLGNAIESACPIVVVATQALVPLATTLVARRDVVVLADAEAQRGGVGRSIACGVAERPDAPAWLVLPADMPMVRAQSILAVAAALDEHAIAYSQYRGRRGHPVGFSAELYSELTTLDGDEGARRIVARFPAHAVDVDDPGVLVDIDTQADLDAVRSKLSEAEAPPLGD